MRAIAAILLFLSCTCVAKAQYQVPSTNIYYTSSNGNLGVGLTAPHYPLDVNGYIHTNSLFIADAPAAGNVGAWIRGATTGNANMILQANAGTAAAFWLTAADVLRLGGTGSTEPAAGAINITTGGNVGVGTTAPASMLDVRGQVNAATFWLKNGGTGYDNALHSTYGTNNFDLIGTYNGWDPNGVFVAGYNAASTGSGPYATQKVYIGSPYSGTNDYVCVNFMTGTVGIGTTSTGTNKLAVEGTIGARKVVVTQTSPFPDYVFEPGYRLTSLDSLRRYVETNRHLPDIPSADSVARVGLDLGSNQTALVKKVEELTLYIIKQDQKIEELCRRMEKMQRNMEEKQKQ